MYCRLHEKSLIIILVSTKLRSLQTRTYSSASPLSDGQVYHHTSSNRCGTRPSARGYQKAYSSIPHPAICHDPIMLLQSCSSGLLPLECKRRRCQGRCKTEKGVQTSFAYFFIDQHPPQPLTPYSSPRILRQSQSLRQPRRLITNHDPAFQNKSASSGPRLDLHSEPCTPQQRARRRIRLGLRV